MLFIHVMVTVVRLAGPGELRSVVAESVDKAGPQPCPGFAGAGQEPPALDTAAVPPSSPMTRVKDKIQGSCLLERVK